MDYMKYHKNCKRQVYVLLLNWRLDLECRTEAKTRAITPEHANIRPAAKYRRPSISEIRLYKVKYTTEGVTKILDVGLPPRGNMVETNVLVVWLFWGLTSI